MRSKSAPYTIVNMPARERRRTRERFAVRRHCPSCGVDAIVPLSPDELAAQTDDTTHVCHPAIGGCSAGFRLG